MATDKMVIILSITKSIYSVIPKTVKKCGYLIHVVLWTSNWASSHDGGFNNPGTQCYAVQQLTWYD